MTPPLPCQIHDLLLGDLRPRGRGPSAPRRLAGSGDGGGRDVSGLGRCISFLRMEVHRNDFRLLHGARILLPLFLPVVERRYGHLGVFGVGVADGFGVVPQGLLGKAFGIAALEGALGPRVAIRVEGELMLDHGCPEPWPPCQSASGSGAGRRSARGQVERVRVQSQRVVRSRISFMCDSACPE